MDDRRPDDKRASEVERAADALADAAPTEQFTPPPPPAMTPPPPVTEAAPPSNWQQPTTAAAGPAWGQPPPGSQQPLSGPPPAPAWQQPQVQPSAQPAAYVVPAAMTAAPPPATPPSPSAWGQPPVQPATQWVQPAPMVARQGGTTGLAKIGSIVLILFGLLWTLLGVIVVVAVNTFIDLLRPQLDQISIDAAETFTNIAIGFGVVLLVLGILQVLSGIFSWRGSGWARFVGIAFGAVFGLLFLAGLLGPRATTADVDSGNSIATTAVGAIAYLYVAIVFLFRYRSRQNS